MISLNSTIEGYENTFHQLQESLIQEDFVLGSGYTYEHGYFDKGLDQEAEVYRYYLRIPANALNGELDHSETIIRLGKPFIIKHEVRTGIDPSADIGITTALINQFTKPLPSEEDPIADKYIQRAKDTLTIIEQKLIH